jgi:hypothetical protein
MPHDQSSFGFAHASKLADLFGGYIDRPNLTGRQYSNPTYSDDPSFGQFSRYLGTIVGKPTQFYHDSPDNPQQFGELQNPPQYRGIRMLLPDSGGDYESLKYGRIPNYEGLQQMFLGEMIRRGYPVMGGTGQMPGYEKGFNPIGFGQR